MSNQRKTVIISDTTCDLSDELVAKYDIKLIPLYVTINNKTLKDKFEITPDDIYDNYNKTKQLPKTSAASIQDHIDMIEKYKSEGSDIVYFSISSSLSCNHNNLKLAAEDYDNVYFIDSANLSTGIGLLVLRAAELADEGKSGKEIFDEIEETKNKVDASFVVDNLEYLSKGGRCSSVAALGANILKLRPCIVVRNGGMTVGKKYRGQMVNVLQQYADEMLADLDNIESDRIFITHSGCSDECINAVYEVVKSKNKFKEILITRAGCTISSHCGPGTLGVLFIRKTVVE